MVLSSFLVSFNKPFRGSTPNSQFQLCAMTINSSHVHNGLKCTKPEYKIKHTCQCGSAAKIHVTIQSGSFCLWQIYPGAELPTQIHFGSALYPSLRPTCVRCHLDSDAAFGPTCGGGEVSDSAQTGEREPGGRQRGSGQHQHQDQLQHPSDGVGKPGSEIYSSYCSKINDRRRKKGRRD